ncbi:hypothetical protein CY35_13G051900 [Sphagnum magellanicum]|nr:hypothetical protein CY35_13G051900 [Sphagnum magellanicum]
MSSDVVDKKECVVCPGQYSCVSQRISHSRVLFLHGAATIARAFVLLLLHCFAYQTRASTTQRTNGSSCLLLLLLLLLLPAYRNNDGGGCCGFAMAAVIMSGLSPSQRNLPLPQAAVNLCRASSKVGLSSSTSCLLQKTESCSSSSSSVHQRRLYVLRKLVMVLGSLVLCCFLSIHLSKLLLSRANELGRQCSVGGGGGVGVEGSGGGGGGGEDRQQARLQRLEMLRSYKFAMVTCSDGSRINPQRSFEGLMELVTPNKRSYVARHGYEFVDASDVLDKERPPSWSKILAVKKNLPHYDWVFWNDADSVVTNPAISLEEIIHSAVGDSEVNSMPDFIITKDVTGVNAGMFFFRNSEWSRHFLDLWWNQTAFVQPFGQSKSGDNDALKHLLDIMPENERNQHIRIPQMQCLFNSNVWKFSWRSGLRLVTVTKTIWQGVYSKGDFMVHLAGLDDKKKLIEEVLHDIKEEGRPSWRRLKV